MASHLNIRRAGRAIALALATLALAAPASIARPLYESVSAQPQVAESTVRPAPDAVRPMSMAELTEAEVLASRGTGAPRPVILAAAPPEPAGGDAPAVWAAGAGTTIALMTFAAWALATRRRARAAA